MRDLDLHPMPFTRVLLEHVHVAAYEKRIFMPMIWKVVVRYMYYDILYDIVACKTVAAGLASSSCVLYFSIKRIEIRQNSAISPNPIGQLS